MKTQNHYLLIFPYWGSEHRSWISHPYLRKQDTQLILVHPEVHQLQMQQKRCIRVYPLHHDMLGVGDRCYDSIATLLFRGVCVDIAEKADVTVMYVPKEYISYFGTFLCNLPDIVFSGQVFCDPDFRIKQGGQSYIYFERSYFFVTSAGIVKTVCRLHTVENSFSMTSDLQSWVIKDNGGFIRPFQKEFDGPIQIRS